MLPTRIVFCRLLSAALIVFLIGCGHNSTQVSAPAPSSSQHLYVGAGFFPGTGTNQIQQFTLPITSTSTSAVSLPTTFVFGLAVDSNGNIAAGDMSGHLAVFNAPLGSSTTASAMFSNGTAVTNEQLAFNAAGDLFATDGFTDVNLFRQPFTSASTLSQVISAVVNGLFNIVSGAALDSSGNLILSSNAVSNNEGNLIVFAPPYTGPAITTALQANTHYSGLALSSTQLFVASALGNPRIDVYNLPIAANSAQAFSITSGLFNPTSVALDSKGNLYVANTLNIVSYTAPLSASSTPSVILTLGGPVTSSSIAIGK